MPACTRKLAYVSVQEAAAVAKRRAPLQGSALYVYRCNAKPHFHYHLARKRGAETVYGISP